MTLVNEDKNSLGVGLESLSPTQVGGRVLDALVAEKVMGWRVERDPYRFPDHPCGYEDAGDFQPSTDIEAAMLVVEKMRELGCKVELTSVNEPDGSKWRASITHYGRRYGTEHAYSNTLPEAICLAALKAVESQGSGVE